MRVGVAILSNALERVKKGLLAGGVLISVGAALCGRPSFGIQGAPTEGRPYIRFQIRTLPS